MVQITHATLFILGGVTFTNSLLLGGLVQPQLPKRWIMFDPALISAADGWLGSPSAILYQAVCAVHFGGMFVGVALLVAAVYVSRLPTAQTVMESDRTSEADDGIDVPRALAVAFVWLPIVACTIAFLLNSKLVFEYRVHRSRQLPVWWIVWGACAVMLFVFLTVLSHVRMAVSSENSKGGDTPRSAVAFVTLPLMPY